MLEYGERAYFERRAIQERHLAARARDLHAKAAHLTMARHYELCLDVELGQPERAGDTEAPSPSILQILPPTGDLYPADYPDHERD